MSEFARILVSGPLGVGVCRVIRVWPEDALYAAHDLAKLLQPGSKLEMLGPSRFDSDYADTWSYVVPKDARTRMAHKLPLLRR